LGDSSLIKEPNCAGRAALIRVLWLLLGTHIVLSIWYQDVNGSNAKVTVAAGLLLTIVLVWWWRQRLTRAMQSLGSAFSRVPIGVWLGGCLLVGVALRLTMALVFPMQFYSDEGTYWHLAVRLAEHGIYGGDPTEPTRSYWPPGLPLFYYPMLRLFGPQIWLPTLINLALYAALLGVLYLFARRLFDEATARVATVLLTLWPNLILLTSAPSKELLVCCLLSVAALLYWSAVTRWSPGLAAPGVIGAGLCLALAALAQPSTLLFGAVLLAFEVWDRQKLARPITRFALLLITMVAAIAPWTWRNYQLHGTLIPITTNSGLALLSANNPRATGGWIAMDYEPYLDDEVAGNRRALRESLAWITANPVAFVKLAPIKQSRLLCCDDYGAFRLFEHPKVVGSYPKIYGRVAAWVSDSFWYLLTVLLLVAGMTAPLAALNSRTGLLLLLAAVWYFVAIHGVYQSENKHHINVAMFLVIVAATAASRWKERA
jgi:Dolichyl-phosphate-mannose-protein mannosyltransferase